MDTSQNVINTATLTLRKCTHGAAMLVLNDIIALPKL